MKSQQSIVDTKILWLDSRFDTQFSNEHVEQAINHGCTKREHSTHHHCDLEHCHSLKEKLESVKRSKRTRVTSNQEVDTASY